MILFKKMLRDVAIQKVSFAAIFFMMGMGLFIFSGISSEYHGMEVASSSFQKKTNMADAWIYGSYIPIETLKQDPRLQLQETMLLEAKQPELDAALTIHVIKEQKISTMMITEGKPLASNIDGVWIDAEFAKVHGWQLQDQFQFTYNGRSYTKEIVGFGYACDHVYQVKEGELLSDHEKNGYLFVYANQIDLPFYANEVTIRSNQSDLKQYLLDRMDGFQGSIVLQEQHPSYIMLKEEIQQHKEIGLIFAVSFLFIAILVSITTIHRLMHSQRTQIGILKALGFSRKKLYLHYMSHCTLITLTAAFTGSMLGQLILPSFILPIIKDMYSLPEMTGHPLPFTFLLPVACALLAALISFLVCRSYLHTSASDILSGRSTHRQQHQTSLPAICNTLSFASRWNLRDLMRNPLRGFMTLLGVCGCSALLFSAMGLSATMTHLSEWNYRTLETYDCKMTGNFSDEAKKTSWIQEMQADELMESSVEIKHENQKKDVALTVFSDQRYLHLALDLHTMFKLDDTGIAVSKKVADAMDLEQGDTLSWRLLGTDHWHQDTITAIIRTPLTQGITMSQVHLEEKGATFTTTSLIGHSITPINDPDITSLQYRKDLSAGMETLLEATTMLILVFFLAAVFLGGVILYNLGSLSYLERYRELATMKVLGFCDKRIRKILIQQNIWLTIGGILSGLICGYGLLLFMMSTIQDALDILVYIPAVIYVIAALGTLLLSWIIAVFVSKKIRKLNMVEALKAQE